MITWTKKDYGYNLTISDPVSADDTVRLIQTARQDISVEKSGFCIFVNFSGIQILHPTIRTIIFSFAKFCRLKGMKRSVVIYSNELTVIQVKMMSRKVNISNNERYINSSKVPNWKDQALRWLTEGIEPEIKHQTSHQSIPQ